MENKPEHRLNPETIAKLITDDLETNNGVVSEKEWEKVLNEKELTAAGRKQIDPKNFVFPKEKRYPIQDLAHARNALSRVSANGTESEKKAVRSAVYAKYPALKKRKEENK